MPTSPVFDLPYPGPGDANNAPADLFALAARLEEVLPTSGTYTPTLTHVSNVSASAALPNAAIWTRNGDVVTVDGKIDVDPIAATATEVGISLPVPSQLAAFIGLTGTAVIQGGSGFFLGRIDEDSTNDRAVLYFTSPITSLALAYYHFSYKVI